MAVLVGGWLAMPRLMHLVSGGGPLIGVAVGIAFIMAFFAVLWLRAYQQRRIKGD